MNEREWAICARLRANVKRDVVAISRGEQEPSLGDDMPTDLTGPQLAKIREGHFLKQAAVARSMGMWQSQLSTLEHCPRAITALMRQRFLAAITALTTVS
jgi:hypothetical protein